MNEFLPTPWSAATWTIFTSTLLGAVVVWRLPNTDNDPWQTAHDQHADLQARYRQYVALLQDLQEQHDRISSDVYAIQKATYEAHAAQALEQMMQKQAQLQQLKETRMHSSRSQPRTAAPSGQLKGFVWGALTMGLLAFLWSLVQSESRTQPPMQPAAPMANAAPGATTAASPGTAPSPDVAKMHELAEAIRAEPNNVTLLLQFAHVLLRAQMLEEAKTINDRALKLEPNNLEALTHAAVLAASEGNMPAAEVGLDTIVGKHPTFSEAWFFRGMLALQQGKTERMRESFEAFIQHAEDGPQKQRVQQMLERFAASP